MMWSAWTAVHDVALYQQVDNLLFMFTDIETNLRRVTPMLVRQPDDQVSHSELYPVHCKQALC